MPYYNAGDYYGRGDYYQGDPGLLSGIGSIFKKAIGVIAPAALGFITGGPAGGIAGAIKGTISTVRKGITEETLAAGGAAPPMIAPMAPGGIGIMAPGGGGPLITQSPLGTPVSAGAIERQLHPFGARRTHENRSTYTIRGGGTSRWGPPRPPQLIAKGTVAVVNRRMNPANPRALRRSLRRVVGFAKLAARARKSVAHAAVAVGVRHRGAKRKK